MPPPLKTRAGNDAVAISPAPDDGPASPRFIAVPVLADVFRRHAADVGRWAARLGGPAIDVDDVVQEVFIIAGRKLGRFRGEAKVMTWLFRITDRVVRNHRRFWRVRRVLTRLTARLGERLAEERGDPEAALAAREAVVAAYRVLDGLPDRYRRVLILFELEGLSSEEIAPLLGARIETVRVWLHRARRMFLAGQEALRREEEVTPS
jgi:RNA polymerase sigma-70 factor (ECF subfamily)